MRNISAIFPGSRYTGPLHLDTLCLEIQEARNACDTQIFLNTQ